MGKGRQLASQVDKRLENLEAQLKDTFIEVFKATEERIQSLESTFEVKFAKLEENLTNKYEEKLAKLEDDLKRKKESIERLEHKAEEISLELPFLEIKVNEAESRLENFQNVGLSFISQIEENLKFIQGESSSKIASFRKVLAKSNKKGRLEIGKLTMKVKFQARGYKFGLQKIKETTEFLLDKNETLNMDSVTHKEELEHLRLELQKHSSVELALLKDNIASNQAKISQLEEDQHAPPLRNLVIMKLNQELQETRQSMDKIPQRVNVLESKVLSNGVKCLICDKRTRTQMGMFTHYAAKHENQLSMFPSF